MAYIGGRFLCCWTYTAPVAVRSSGCRVSYMPPGLRKSGMPADTLTPAPCTAQNTHDTPHHPDCRRTHSRPHPSRNTHIHAIHHTTGPHARSAGPESVQAARHRCTHREEGHRLGAREHVRHLLDRCHPRRHLRAGGACDAGGESQGGTRGRCSGSKEPGQQPSRARTASARNGVSVPAPGQALQRVCAGFGRTVSLPVRAQFSVFWEAHAARGTAHAPSTPCRQKAAARCA